MNTPIAVRIECAKGEILNAMEAIQTKHALPPCIMDGVLSSVLAEVRSEAKIELINSTNAMMAEKDEELEKAKKAAKRTLRTESRGILRPLRTRMKQSRKQNRQG